MRQFANNATNVFILDTHIIGQDQQALSDLVGRT
jgi:hypothetical protein